MRSDYSTWSDQDILDEIGLHLPENLVDTVHQWYEHYDEVPPYSVQELRDEIAELEERNARLLDKIEMLKEEIHLLEDAQS